MRRRWPWLLALLPAALGLAIDLWIVLSGAWNPRAYIEATVSDWALIAGLALSAPLVAGLGVWRLAERRQRQAVEMVRLDAVEDRRRFLRRLDHELKNPLTAIQAGLALVNEAEDSRLQPEALGTVAAQVRRMSRLTADLRKLAELEGRPLELAPVNLSDLLTQVFEMTQERPEAAGRRLSLSLPQAPWPLPAISGDFDLLLLVAHNLLDNAIKFTRPGDTVEIRAFEDGASVVVEVADTGPGIPGEELPHVWEELYRGAGARGVPGSGLGLALVRAIIQRHGGQVALRSRAGQGTVVTVRLPLKT